MNGGTGTEPEPDYYELRARCEKCGERPGTQEFYWDMLELTHGHSKWWCDKCVLQTQLAFCQDQAAKIPDIVQKLRELDAQE